MICFINKFSKAVYLRKALRVKLTSERFKIKNPKVSDLFWYCHFFVTLKDSQSVEGVSNSEVMEYVTRNFFGTERDQR